MLWEILIKLPANATPSGTIVPRVISLYATLVTQLVTQAWKQLAHRSWDAALTRQNSGRGDRI